jgi:hypothetical protein
LRPAYEGFYFWASDGLVTRSVARYNYGGNWTISTGGTFARKQRQLASLQHLTKQVPANTVCTHM